MRKTIMLLAYLFMFKSNIIAQQVPLTQPKIMVVPFAKKGEDIRTVLDNDVFRRIAITKVKEGFDNAGYTTVDFVGKLNTVKDNQIFTSSNQSDIKTKIIEMSGCDIYVAVETNIASSQSGNSVTVILSAYETSTGNSLSNAIGHSGEFYTNDVAALTSRAINRCIGNFINTMNENFIRMEENGRSILVDFSFSDNSIYSMSSKIGKDSLALSDILENWVSANSLNNGYHIQGVTDLKMIFDDIKIPLRNSNGNNYDSNKYALKIYDFLKSIGLSSNKDIKGNTIYITIN